MNSSKKPKLPTEHAQRQPAREQVSHPAQAKAAAKRPAAPPAYRPQQSNRPVQPKSAQKPGQAGAPSVYRPQPTPKCLQAKIAIGRPPMLQRQESFRTPAAPHPQPGQKVLQAKTATPQKPPHHPGHSCAAPSLPCNSHRLPNAAPTKQAWSGSQAGRELQRKIIAPPASSHMQQGPKRSGVGTVQRKASAGVIQMMNEVTNNFRGIRIYLYGPFYNANNGEHSFQFTTQLLFDSNVTDQQFLNDLVFTQWVQSSSAKRPGGATNYPGTFTHQTQVHDDNYSSDDFTQSGSYNPNVSYVMTSDTPGVDGFTANDEIHWVFNFWQTVMERTNTSLIHRTPQLSIVVDGRGANAQMMPAQGLLYNSAGI